jgi:putative aldouronate transport system permease protein
MAAQQASQKRIIETGNRLTCIRPVPNVILNVVFALIALCCVLPVVLIISVSFTPESIITREGYNFIPSQLTTYNYNYLFQQSGVVLRAYGITLIVTSVGTVASSFIIAMYAYPLSRSNYPYRRFFTVYLFITMIFSGGLVPYFVVMNNVLKVSNSIWCLLLPLLFNAFWCIVMRTFYQHTIPDALIESAKLDGASEFRTLVQIVFPISLPGLATVALFMMVTYWNDYYNAMLFLTSNDAKDSLQTMQYLCYRALSSVAFLRTQAAQMGILTAEQLKAVPDEGYRMAIAVVTMGPILIVYPFFQRYFIQGLTIGSVKG